MIQGCGTAQVGVVVVCDWNSNILGLRPEGIDIGAARDQSITPFHRRFALNVPNASLITISKAAWSLLDTFDVNFFFSAYMAQENDPQEVCQSSRLPFELVEIISHTIRIDAQECNDTTTLKACPLVSSDWTILFQRMLFEILGLTAATLTFSNGASDKQRGRTIAFCHLLDVNPSFGKAMGCLRIDMVNEECLQDSTSTSECHWTVPWVLSLLTGIKTLSISRFDGSNQAQAGGSWSKFSGELQEAIAALIRSPSLKDLTIVSFDGPLDVLLPEGAEFETLTLGAGITSLELNNALDDADTPGIVAAPLPTSKRLCIVRHLISKPRNAAELMQATHLGHTQHRHHGRTSVIDHFAVQSLNVTVFYEEDVKNTRGVLQRAANLRRLSLYFGVYISSLHSGQRTFGLISHS